MLSEPETLNIEPETLNQLPPGFRLATLSDFHFQGRPKAGMKFILKQSNNETYEEYKVRPTLTTEEIKPFIDTGRCWVLG
ncbi:MAG: hypothetical protein IH597_15055 [Bacteroidales bacterium]|nr:hypothetical protein [Bacteroidales bacterium]